MSSDARPVDQGPLESRARTWEDLAKLLIRLRGKTSLERLVAHQPHERRRVTPSTSTLSRYETGRTRPPLKMAEHLDALYGADGLVEMSLRSLWRGRWKPWGAHEARLGKQQAFSWPARYEGAVWIKVVPHVDHVGREHTIRLAWGPWRHEQKRVLDERGIVLSTGKAEDRSGVAVTMNMDTDLAVFALSGIGEDVVDENLDDIRSAWWRRDE